MGKRAPETLGWITVDIVNSGGEEWLAVMRKTTTMMRLMKRYCAELQLDPSTLIFVYKARRIRPDETAESLGLKTGETIDAIQI